jgi:hypothetical protein
LKERVSPEYDPFPNHVVESGMKEGAQLFRNAYATDADVPLADLSVRPDILY